MPKALRVSAGYSGTPLLKKLGIKPNTTIRLYHEPEYYLDLFPDFPAEVAIAKNHNVKKELIHYFARGASRLAKDLPGLREEMKENGALWISWPKKGSAMETDLSENIIRDLALRNGLVDVKVCAIDDIWSGLKLVIRVKDRKEK